jgi:hypothetical protein
MGTPIVVAGVAGVEVGAGRSLAPAGTAPRLTTNVVEPNNDSAIRHPPAGANGCTSRQSRDVVRPRRVVAAAAPAKTTTRHR